MTPILSLYCVCFNEAETSRRCLVQWLAICCHGLVTFVAGALHLGSKRCMLPKAAMRLQKVLPNCKNLMMNPIAWTAVHYEHHHPESGCDWLQPAATTTVSHPVILVAGAFSTTTLSHRVSLIDGASIQAMIHCL
jgi:apolipoprotein N-acyltransferase